MPAHDGLDQYCEYAFPDQKAGYEEDAAENAAEGTKDGAAATGEDAAEGAEEEYTEGSDETAEEAPGEVAEEAGKANEEEEEGDKEEEVETWSHFFSWVYVNYLKRTPRASSCACLFSCLRPSVPPLLDLRAHKARWVLFCFRLFVLGGLRARKTSL